MIRKDFLPQLNRVVSSGIMTGKKVCLFGTSNYMYLCNSVLHRDGIEVVCFFENDPKQQGNTIFGVPVVSPKEWHFCSDEHVVLVYSGHENEMIDQLHELGIEDSSIIHIPWPKSLTVKNPHTSIMQYKTFLRMSGMGREVYKRINVAEHILIQDFSSSLGDTYLLMLFLQKYLDRNRISDYVYVYSGGGCEQVLELYHIDSRIRVNEREKRQLVDFIHFVGEENLNCKFLRPSITAARICYFDQKLSWPEIVPRWVYSISDPEGMMQLPVYDCVGEEELKETGMIRGKSVIIAPYAQTSSAIPLVFWEELVNSFQMEGYRVFTNVAGDEEAINGTRALCIPLRALKSFLQFAGAFVAMRSGLCDLVSHIDGFKQIILYEGTNYVYGRRLPAYIDCPLDTTYARSYSQQLFCDGMEVSEILSSVLELIRA